MHNEKTVLNTALLETARLPWVARCLDRLADVVDTAVIVEAPPDLAAGYPHLPHPTLETLRVLVLLARALGECAYDERADIARALRTAAKAGMI